jgi:hypothetical protein
MKSVVRILLGISIVFLGYLCVVSVLTPIRFEEEKAKREKVIVQHLINIRAAQLEFKEANGRYTANIDSLVNFLQTAKKKEVKKEGALTEAQLEAGLTEEKAVKIIKKGDMKEIIANGLTNFRRDTVYTDMIVSLYKDAYTAENIATLFVVPFSNGQQFEVEVNNTYMSSSNINVPLFEARASYDTYLGDLNKQELANAKDVANTLERYAGLKVGSVVEPNNNAGNWE